MKKTNKAIALCSPLMPEEIRREIEAISGSQSATIPPCDSLDAPVCHHPDMLFFNHKNERITILSEGYYSVNHRFFHQFPNASLCLDSVPLAPKYPHDIPFDAIGIGERLYCLETYTSKEIKRRFKKIINVKQGYAACSTLILNERAAITADGGIARALMADGVNTLLISPNGISLPGYDNGFIGGATAVINETVFFFGSLYHHPSGELIRRFCLENDFSIVDFPHLPLTDYGSVRYLYSK